VLIHKDIIIHFVYFAFVSIHKH